MSTTETQNLLDASADDLRAMGLPPAFTLAELQASFSEEEIAKLAEGDDPLVKLPDQKAAAADDDGDPDEDDDAETDDDTDDDADGEADGDNEGDDEAEAETGDTAEAAQEAQEPADPVYQPRDVTKFQAVIDGAAAERKALRSAYDDGDMTDEEYDRKLDDIAEKVIDAKAEIKDAKREDDKNLARVQDAWFGKVDAFLEANPAFRDNTPNPKLEGNSYLTALDQVMRAVNQDQRYAGMTMSQRIDASAQIVRAYVQQQTGADIPGMETKKAPAGKKADAENVTGDSARDKARQKAKGQGKRPDPVQTLGNVTAATETEADNSRFAALDREKSGLDREREFSRMSAEEQDAYLKGL